ncbi:MAG TPA: hypothetical protein PL173_13050 [Saprospiraceae bacterium]|nr:hypothetical protein [Saprospiraceae bacterium]HNI55789.1 hypothetical protein [Chitinophagales bacterium]
MAKKKIQTKQFKIEVNVTMTGSHISLTTDVTPLICDVSTIDVVGALEVAKVSHIIQSEQTHEPQH